MGILNRFFGRPQIPSESRRVLSDVSGRMSACAAWSIVEPSLLAVDREAKLTLVTSGLDLDQNGQSRIWEFVAVLPGVRARCILSIAPQDGAEDPDAGPFEFIQRFSRISPEEIGRARPLPHVFRDSPQAVADFVAAGVDFVSGPSDMKVETQIGPSDHAEWVTFCWSKKYTSAFEE